MTASVGKHYYTDRYEIEGGERDFTPASEGPPTEEYQNFEGEEFAVEEDSFVSPETSASDGPAGDDVGVGEEIPETDSSDTSALTQELNQFKNSVLESENLSEEKKREYAAGVEQSLKALELGKGDPEAIVEDIEALRDQFQELSRHSPGAVALAQAAEADPQEIEALAKARNIDLKNPPQPPNQTLLEFLAEVSPKLGEQASRVQDAVRARNGKIEETEAACRAQNAANTACSSDHDNTDLTNFQFAYDLKYHQDQWSQDVQSAMTEAKGIVIELITALYPKANLGPAPSGGAEGWKAAHEAYLAADKISFNGLTLDVFNGASGELSIGGSETENDIEIPVIQYDWEGSGDWEDGAGRPHINSYDEKIHSSSYDG